MLIALVIPYSVDLHEEGTGISVGVALLIILAGAVFAGIKECRIYTQGNEENNVMKRLTRCLLRLIASFLFLLFSPLGWIFAGIGCIFLGAAVGTLIAQFSIEPAATRH